MRVSLHCNNVLDRTLFTFTLVGVWLHFFSVPLRFFQCVSMFLAIPENPANQFHFAFWFFNGSRRRTEASAGGHEATHVHSSYYLLPDIFQPVSHLTAFAQLWQLMCGDVDSHDLTRLVPLFAERHLQALTRLNLHLFLPTPIRCNRRKLWP